MANYPISNVSRRVVYTGSAGVGPYSFTFEIINSGDVDVYKNDTLLTLTTNYTVTINANGTGSVTLVVAATGTDRITIVGARAIERTTDFVTGGDLFANTLNEEIDSQTIFVQQVAETAERSIKAPVTDPTNINMTLPSQTSRVGKTLAFDSSGNPIAGDPIGNWRGNWAAAVSYQNRDLIKDTTNSNVYISLAAHTSSGSLPITTNADSAKWALVVDAAAAGTSATAAASSASAAASSASSASTSASNASSSASSASTSAATATTQATNASNSATAAATSETNAGNSASSASTSASNASNSAALAAANAASGLYSSVIDKSANYTVVLADSGALIRVTTTSGAITITLPTISTVNDGFKVAVVKWTGDSNAVSIVRSGSNTINGATSSAIGSQYTSTTFVADFETGQWLAVTSGLGSTNVAVDQFSGNGSTVAFTLSGDAGSENNTQVFVSGVYQEKDTYSLSGTTLTFSAAPPTGTGNIEVVWTAPLSIGVPSDGTVTSAKMADVGVTAATYGSATEIPQISVNAKGQITSASNVAVSGVPVGAVAYIAMNAAPTGWLKANGSAISRSTYSALFAALVTNSGYSSATFTVTIASPAVFTKSAHGFIGGERIRLSTTGALPTGLNTTTDYYVLFVDANTFRLSLTLSGTAINTSGTQSGTHSYLQSLYGLGDGSTTFNIPDLRGEFLRGWDDARGVDTGRTIGAGQLDQMQSITGLLTNVGHISSANVIVGSGAFTTAGSAGGNSGIGNGGNLGANVTFNNANSSGARVGTETRARNIALLACIKF
jgi:microcystin-dependent protein